jgi:protein phosphatase
MALLNLFHPKPKPSRSEPPGVAPPVEPVHVPRPGLPFAVRSFGLSDRGLVRPANEDRFVIAELTRTLRVHHSNLPQDQSTFSCHRGHVFLVADGVGGNAGGEIASGLSVQSIETFLLNTLKRFSNLQASEEQGVLRDLQSALFQADARIFEEATKHPEWKGMGTTLTMAFAVNGRLFVAHAGDSRCYLYSANKLQQLTQDHTMTADFVRHGILTPEKEKHHPWRHVVTNLLGGTERGVMAELHGLDLHTGDKVLLCSDGLTEMVPEDGIAAVLGAEGGPQRACECLVGEANRRGGKDNVTVIVAQVG